MKRQNNSLLNLYSKDCDICENFDLFEKEMLLILKKIGIEFVIE